MRQAIPVNMNGLRPDNAVLAVWCRMCGNCLFNVWTFPLRQYASHEGAQKDVVKAVYTNTQIQATECNIVEPLQCRAFVYLIMLGSGYRFAEQRQLEMYSE